jgi:hypothetical protein
MKGREIHIMRNIREIGWIRRHTYDRVPRERSKDPLDRNSVIDALAMPNG